MTHNLMDLQVGGVSRFRVINTGNIVIGDASAPSASKLNVAGDIFLRTNDSIGGGQTYPTVWNKIMLYNSSNGEMTITMYNISWFLRHNANMSIAGNTVIGTTTPSARLHVRGDGTNPIFRFETSAGVNALGLDATGATLVYNPGLVTVNAELRATHYFSLKIITNYNGFSFTTTAVSNSGLTLANSAASVSYLNFAGTESSGHYALRAVMNFSQSSGVVPFDVFSYTGTINQTGTANGITRGLYVNPTLTSAVDFRAIEVKAGSTPAHKLLLLTDGSGNKVFEVNGKQEVGFFGSTPSGKLDVTGSRSNPEQALASLLTALATYGIIVDATTA